MERNEENQGERACVLVSGGSDSSILLYETAQKYSKVTPLYIRNGLLWEETELFWLERFVRSINQKTITPLRVLSLPMEDVYDTHWSLTGEPIPDHASSWEEVYLPGRNLILLSKAVVFCALNEIQAIALGPLKTNQFADSSSTFFSGLRKVAEEGLSATIEILTPLATRSKSEVLQSGSRLPLELTFSCINPQGRLHCGVCNKCAERIEAFSETGLRDKTVYHNKTVVEKRSSDSKNGRYPLPLS